jgi:uncharacterized repeat protein (TIGR01451 family)
VSRRTGPVRRILATIATVSLLAMVGAAVTSTTASSVGTVLFDNLFNDRTVDGVGTVTVPTPVTGPNVACLTARGNSATLPLLSCAGSIDSQGFGKLRLTGVATNQVGGVFAQSSFPTSNGLDVTFDSYQWGGNGADGMAFLLAAVDPANPVTPTSLGSSGGALGYSAAPGLNGLTNAYLGVGLDVFGNFSSNSYSGTGCTNPPTISVATPGAVVVRGPGNLKVGYCGLTSTYNGTVGSKVTLRATARTDSVVPVEVLINPTAVALTADSGVTAAAGTYKVVITPVGQATRTLSGPLPSVPSGLYPSDTWLASGVPKQLAFGFVGSTGSVTDVHEITDVRVLALNPVPQLAVSTTGYAATTSVPGDPVTYKATSSVLAGADETKPISTTLTTPAGVVPVGAYGTGWVCQPRSGQTITCTTSGSSFPDGTTLPVLTVVAIVTASSVSATLIQNGSTTRTSSTDGNPATDSVTTLGTRPTGPVGVTVSPSIGSVAGGGLVIIGGTNIVAATAIEIGTAAEQQAGTPVVLLPCSGSTTVGCFAVSNGMLVIYSMPARATAATVSVTVVTAGIAGAASYVYADRPDTAAAPTATAGITSATVTWAAPASNGSAITGYVVTPYRNGIAQTTQSFDTSTTTRTFTGLTAGSSYTFTVSAVNAYGTAAASAQSAAVVPYALPGAPVISAANAGSQLVTLTWSAPASNGSAITGYVVTPYIGTVAQPTQSFSGTATTRTVTGLAAGTSYTFKVAAQNVAGTGPQSASSAAVTPNMSPTLTFAAPPGGEVNVNYSRLLTVTNGTSPFVWSVSSGALPPGLTLDASTGLLSGTPTLAGSFAFTAQVTDASGLTATKAVTLVIAPAPSMTFTPADGEVGIAYSQQPVLTGGTGPFTWSIVAGSLPAGLTLNSTTGLVSGVPSASGGYTLTIAVTDAYGQVASRTVAITIAARPAFTATAPPAGQVGVAYTTTFTVTGGSLPLTWSVSAGSLPAGLTFNTGTGVLSGTPTTVGSFPFTVSVSDANAVAASKAVTLVIGTGPLVILKTANVSSAVAGSVVGYTITITNTGSTAFTGVVLSDPLTGVLDDAGYNANATATAGTVSYAAPTLGWTGNIAAGAVVTIGYSVTVNNPDLGNRILSNAAASSTLGANCGAGSADTRCAATVTVPGLTIVKTADVANTTPGSTVRFSIVITNTGQTSYPAATLTDSLAGVLDDAGYNADAVTTAGNVSYTSPALTWTGALAPGASSTITYTVTVADPDTGNRSLTGSVVSPSAGSPCPSGNAAPQCTATVTVLVPALSITNDAAASTTTPGGTIAYTVVLSNTGQTAYNAITVTVALGDVLTDATYNNNAVATAGSVRFDAGTGSLVWTGNVATGAAVTISASVTVRDPYSGDQWLTTEVTSPAPGSTCPVGGTSVLCTSTVQVRIPELTIAKSTNVSTTTPGSVVGYTVSATNNGQTPYAGATFSDAMTGVLDDATYNGDAAVTGGTVSVTGSAVIWTGNLAIGASATLTYSVTVTNPDTGNRTLTGAVTSTTAGNNCRAGSGDPRCASSVPVLIPGLSIVSATAETTAIPGDLVHYSATVTNTGQTAYNGVAITLDLIEALDDARYNYDATISTGSLVTHPDGSVDWVLNLAPGASAVGTIGMTVNDTVSDDRSLLITAVSNAPGSTCPAGSPAPSCNAVVTVLVPGLTITKAADTSTVSPGGTVGYTITVVNDGETAYPAASLSDDLSLVLTDATYSGDATATTGTVSFDASVLTWTGALTTGASATIGYTVTVRDPDPGDKRMVNTVESSAPGSNCRAGTTDVRCTAAVNVLVPGLTIVKTATTATTAPGATIGYTIAVTNTGATSFTGATFADELAGVLDDADYNADASASTGTVGFTSPTLTWTGNLGIAATAIITYSVTVHAADVGDDLVTNTVTSVTPGSNCVTDGTDKRCVAKVAVARLIIAYGAMDPTTTPGAVVDYLATYTNTGRVPYDGIVISVDVMTAIDDILGNGDQFATSGTLILNETGITWNGDIPVGGVVTVTASVTVQNPDLGDRVFTTTNESTAPGSNCPAGGTDPRCSATVTVLVPQLTIAKAASTTFTVSGGTVGYTVTVHNTGQTDYTAASVADVLTGVLDDATYNGDATVTTGELSYSSPTLTWTGDLTAGQTATISYSTTARSPATGDKTMVNTVSSSAVGSTCAPASGNAACRSTVAVLTAALTIVKTTNVPNVTLGSILTYIVTVTNTGQLRYAAAQFSDSLNDVLDDGVYNHDATASTGTVGYTGSLVSWSGALNPGTSATVTYSVTINLTPSDDGATENTVVSTSDGSNCATGSTDTRCSAMVTITNVVDLTFTKTADVAATVAGAVVTYTVTVANSTPLNADGVELTDPLAAVLDDADYNGDATASGGTATFSSSNVTWTGTVPAAGSVTITYSVTVHGTATGDQVLAGTISSTSASTSNNCLADTGDPRCTSTVPVAGLLLEQHFTETSTTPGSVVHLSATFTNTGQLPYQGISISSPSGGVVDDAIPVGDQTATTGTLVLGASAITWTGDIPVGGMVTVVGTLTVKNPDPADRILTGTLVSAALGNNCVAASTDTRCVSYLPVLLPGLTITKAVDTTYVVPGGVARYTVTVENSGETAYPAADFTDTLSGVLDDATYNDDATATAGTVSFDSPTMTWTGALTVDQIVTITYTVTAQSPATGDKTMVNAVDSTTVGNTCPAGSGNTACRGTVAVLTPALTVTSTASVESATPGATVTFMVTATNTGQIPYAAASLSVPLGGVLDDATYSGGVSASTGLVEIGAGTLTWTGALNPGETSTITYAVTVDQPVTGNFRLKQTATSATQGSTCPAADADPRCTTSVPIASLLIVTSADVPTTKPTSVVHYAATFTNTGQVPYVGTIIHLDLVGLGDDAAYNGDAAADGGSPFIDVAAWEVVWTGDLGLGEKVTLTASVTVDNPDLGDKVMTAFASTDAVASNCPAGGPDPVCTSLVTVLTPGLTVSKAADTVVTTPGSTVGYTITITNSGETPYTSATVQDSLTGVLPDATYAGDAGATAGTVSFASPVLTWTGDLATGQTVILSYSVEVNDPDLGDKIMVNGVRSDELGSSCPTGAAGPACATFVVVLVPALDIAVTADRTTTLPGATVGYSVVIQNTGQTAYSGIGVTIQLDHVLDDAGYDGGATATAGTITYTAPSLNWTGNLASGATVTVSYEVTVADPDLGNKLLTTSATSPAPGSTCGEAPACVNTVTVLIPGLSVSATAGVATTTPGSRVVFTVTVANTGQTPYTGTVVSTVLTGILDDAELAGEVVATSGVATYTEPDLSWTGTLPVGVTATISYAVTVRDPDPGDKTLSMTVLAPAPGSTCQEASTDPSCTVTVTVLVPGLAIVKSAGAPTTTPGGVVGYTIVVTNTGQTPYLGATVTDSLGRVLLDADYDGNAALVGGGTLDYASSILTWTGDLLIGASATITYSITVHDPDTGDKLMINDVTSTTPGSTCPVGDTSPACSPEVRVLVPAMVLTKTADTSSAMAGSAVRYTLTVTNTGETAYIPATVADPLAGVLDDATYANDALPTAGTTEYADGILVWTGPLAVGATATITYSVTVEYPASGDGTLANTVSSPSPGANCPTGAEPLCGVTMTVLVPALTIVKSADTSVVVAGGTVRYTITATNTGQAAYPVVTLVDTLAGLLDDADYNGDASATNGSLSYADGTLSWTGELNQQGAVLISYTITVAVGSTSGDGTLTNRVVSPSVGSTCPTGGVEPGCATTTTIAPRTIALADLAPSFTLTGQSDSTVGSDGVVTMTVTTNSSGGYVLSVRAEAAVLTGAAPGNTETIAVGQLSVRESGTGQFQELSADVPLVVHRQNTPSSPDGDAVSNDYRIQIPFVPSDTYSVTLDYIISAQ